VTSACQAGFSGSSSAEPPGGFRAAELEPWAGLIGLEHRPKEMSAGPDHCLHPADPFLVTSRPNRLGSCLSCGRPGESVPTALRGGSLPRLPRNLRPDRSPQVLTTVATSSVPSACLHSHKASLGARPESRAEAVAGSTILARDLLPRAIRAIIPRHGCANHPNVGGCVGQAARAPLGADAGR
jgi:hypothetical protein